LGSAYTRTLKRALYGETQTDEQFPRRRRVRLQADIPLVRLKPDTTYKLKPDSTGPAEVGHHVRQENALASRGAPHLADECSPQNIVGVHTLHSGS
jgi:hypothetical protein